MIPLPQSKEFGDHYLGKRRWLTILVINFFKLLLTGFLVKVLSFKRLPRLGVEPRIF